MPDLKIDIDLQKTGPGAQQAKQELDAVKDSAQDASVKLTDVGQASDKTGVSASDLRFKLYGFHAILSGVTQLARGGTAAFYGFSRAISGVVMVLSGTIWGRLAQIAAVMVALGLSIYNYFHPAQEEIKKTDEALKKLDKTQKDLAEDTLRTAAEYAKQLADEFDRAAEAANRTRKNTDELSSAELALKLAMIDRRVASGEITEDQGKQERIESRLAAEQEKSAREKLDVQNQTATAEKTIADTGETYETAKKERDQAADAYLKARVSAAGKFPGLKTTSEDYSGLITTAKTREEKNAIIELNALKKQLAEAEKAVSFTSKVNLATRAKLEPEVETGQSRLKTLDVLGKASETGASAQSLTVGREIQQKQLDEEKKQLAEIAAAEEKRQAALKQHETGVFREEKTSAISTVDDVLAQQQAEEQVSKIQLTQAERAAGAKGQSSKQRTASATALQSARAAYGKESADVSQAEAIQSKIRTAVDPADVAKLLQALESIGNSFKQVANVAANQASQMKNGGLRTK